MSIMLDFYVKRSLQLERKREGKKKERETGEPKVNLLYVYDCVFINDT